MSSAISTYKSGVYLMVILIIAAFLPIHSTTYLFQAFLPFIFVILFSMGFIKGVRVNFSWMLCLGLLYLYGFFRMAIALSFEEDNLLWINYITWILSTSGMMLFILNSKFTPKKYNYIRSLTKKIIVIEGIIGVFQILLFSKQGMGAGDVVVGTLHTENSHLFGMMMLVLGIGIFLSYLDRNGKKTSLISKEQTVGIFSIVIFILSSFLLGLVYVLAFVSLLICLNLKGKKRISVLIFLGIVFTFFVYTQRENAYFVYDYIFNSGEDFKYSFPNKLQAMIETINLYKSRVELLFFGIGPGLYNSRAAMILTNGYLTNTTLPFSSMSIYTRQLIAPLWDVNSATFVDSVVNQPWFTFFSFIAEFGIVIFGIVLATILSLIKRLGDSITFMFTLFILGTFFLDNLLEFPQYMFVAYVSLWLVYYRPRIPASMKIRFPPKMVNGTEPLQLVLRQS